jgi:hypothetical protein
MATMNYFIAYSRNDRLTMRAIRDELEKEGNTVKTDENISRFSTNWQMEIQDFINYCDAMVVLLTPSSKGSAFVNKEILFAQTMEKNIWSILTSGDEKTSIPLSLMGYNYEDRRKDFGHLSQDE